MKWSKFTLSTTTDAVDYVSEMLSELGIEGIEIEDNIPLSEEDKKRMFIDILPELPENDGSAKVSFYAGEEENVQELLERVNRGLDELQGIVNLGCRRLEASETQDTDWINNWKEFFKPFRVDDTIVIKPTWEELTDVRDGDLVVEIDPGTAFGTGSHETTKLCILNMKKYLKPGMKLLDVGCGSGILSIIGIKLGAGSAGATDIDPNAVSAAASNAEVNHIPVCLEEDGFHCRPGAITIAAGDVIGDSDFRKLTGEKEYDVVAANILADIIIPLSGVVGELMKDGGIFISSGILNTKQKDVEEALVRNGFSIREITVMGDWVSIVAEYTP